MLFLGYPKSANNVIITVYIERFRYAKNESSISFWVPLGSFLGPEGSLLGSRLGPSGPFWDPLSLGTLLGPFWVLSGSFKGPLNVFLGLQNHPNHYICNVWELSGLEMVRFP